MRLRMISNIRKCLSRIIVPLSPFNVKSHCLSISCVAFAQVVIILIIFLVAICGITSLPFVISRAFDYSDETTTQMGFGMRGNEIEYFKGNTCVNSNDNYPRERISNFEQESNVWTRVSDTVYIYSAYLDKRTYSRNLLLSASSNHLSLIRIVGLIRMPPAREIIRANPISWLKIKDETFLGHRYYCRVYQENENGNMIFALGHTLTYTIIEEGVKVFSAAFFNCYVNLTDFTYQKEMHVALYPIRVENYPDKLVRVNHNPQKIVPTNNSIDSPTSNISLSICVRPLFGPMDDVTKIVEFLSYYFRMGVTRFTFYDLSISPGVKYYLRNLHKTGKVNIRLNYWNLPTGNVSELWDFGTLAALNDCLYNNMQESRVLFVDVDEFIVPQGSRKTNLLNILQNYEKYHQLLIRNTFFCQEFCPVNNVSLKYSRNRMQWTVFNCITRTKKIWNADMRSKYIVNPREIVSVGHHLVTKYLNQVDHRFTDKSNIMKSDVALLYHYRHCKPISTPKHPILNRLTITDYELYKYREDLENSLPKIVYNEHQRWPQN